MAGNQRNHKRRVYLIDKKFQGKFILKFSLIVIMGSLIMMAILYAAGRYSTTVVIADSRVRVSTTADFLLPILFQTVFVVTVFVGFLTILLTLFFSHKVAGPIYRFRKVLETLKNGDFSSSFSIRQHDQFHGLTDDFNSMIQSIRDRINILKAGIARLKDKKANITDQDIEELQKDINYFKS